MKNKELLFATFLGTVTTILIIFAFAVPVRGLRDRQIDKQTVSALSEVEYALGDYIAQNNGSLPNSVNDLKFQDYQTAAKNKDVLDRITIEGTANDYKLCATFRTNSEGTPDSQKAAESGTGVSNIVANISRPYDYGYNKHPKGKHCFDRNSRSYPVYPYDDYNTPINGNDGQDGPDGSSVLDGVQQTARDSERKSDINAIYSQVEVYFAQNGRYPELSDLNDYAWRAANVKGLLEDAIHAPGSSIDLVADSGTNIDRYEYATTPAVCDSVEGSGDPDCTGFTLKAVLESGGAFVKTGSNN